MRLRIVFVSILLAGLASCSTPGTRSDLLETTLQSYASTIRWGNFEDAVSFIDPEVVKAHPLTKLDLDRYTQVRVAGYLEQPVRPVGDNEARQTVEITLSNNNTLSVRSFLDRQVWRYDEKAKRWWLMTGLPDITQH